MRAEYKRVPRREHAAPILGPCPDTPPLASAPATEADLAEINRIYNHEVEHGVATWDTEPWTLETRRAWFAEHDAGTPVLVVDAPEDASGRLAGFAYLALHRPRAGYRFTREDTLYVDPPFQRQGIGRALLAALLKEARGLGMHAVSAVIEAENAGSIALHREFGFEIVGREHETGHKFGHWLSNVEMLLILDPGGQRR